MPELAIFKRKIRFGSCARVRRLCRGVCRADLARDPPRFFFDRADAEVGTTDAVVEIFADPLLKSAGAFALREVDKIMQNQFSIVPGVATNKQRVTQAHATRVFGDDPETSRGLGQFRIIRQRNPINHEHSDFCRVLNASEMRVPCVRCAQRMPVRENELFQLFCPLVGKRQQAFEGFLIE